MQGIEPLLSNGAQNIITNITNYDVLADPSLEGVIGEYQLDNYMKSSGNNRLKVFISLHQQDYDIALRQENITGCDSIVSKIIHTLSERCIPAGRFLINTVTNSRMNTMSQVLPSQASQYPIWKLMGEHEAKQLLHGILKKVRPPELYRLRRQQAGMNSNQMSNGTEEHKRRRRSSLLRRSASDSLLDDSKKVSRFDRQERAMQNRRMSREEPTWSSSRRMTNNGIVSLNRMDVILTSTMDALDPNSQSIGNNRLHILVAMQSGKYQQANDHQKEAILDEVMQTVNSFWKGRFLTESMSGCYEVLDHNDAKRSLRHIFDMRSGQNLLPSSSSAPAMNITPNVSTRLNNNSQVTSGGSGNHEFGKMNRANENGNQFRNDPMNMMRGASTSSIPVGNNISNDTKQILSRQMSSSLIPNQASNSSFPTLNPPIAFSGIDNLRSAAVKGLQKQKARQRVASRLENASMRNSQQTLQLQPNNVNIMNGVNGSNSNNNNHNFSSFSMGGGARRRQSSIFGALDPTVMDEIVDGCFDDEDD